jgi:hypothetical protein
MVILSVGEMAIAGIGECVVPLAAFGGVGGTVSPTHHVTNSPRYL